MAQRAAHARAGARLGQIDPAIWVAERAALHKRAYPCESAIGKDYAYAAKPIPDDRPTKAGVRLAAYLNRLLE